MTTDNMKLCKLFAGESPIADFDECRVAASARRLFVVGPPQEHLSALTPVSLYFSLRLTVIDTLSGERHEKLIVDLWDVGTSIAEVYALDDHRLVIVDAEKRQNTLRQRLVLVTGSAQLHSPFHRCYRFSSAMLSSIKVTIGERTCAVLTRSTHLDLHSILIPLDPCSTRSKKNISVLLNRMASNVWLASNGRRLIERLTAFFAEDDQVFCLFAALDNSTRIDPLAVMALDLRTNAVSSIRIDAKDAPLFHRNGPLADEACVRQADRQVLLSCRHRYPDSTWRAEVAELIGWTQLKVVTAFFRTVDYNLPLVGSALLWLNSCLGVAKDRVMIRQEMSLASLDTRKWEWTSLESHVDDIAFSDQLLTVHPSTGEAIVLHRQQPALFSPTLSARLLTPPPTQPVSLQAAANRAILRSDNPLLRYRRSQLMSQYGKIVE